MNFLNKIELCFQKNSALRAKIFRLFRMSTFLGATRLILQSDFRLDRAPESIFFARAFGAIDSMDRTK